MTSTADDRPVSWIGARKGVERGCSASSTSSGGSEANGAGREGGVGKREWTDPALIVVLMVLIGLAIAFHKVIASARLLEWWR
jgi:hypothetical protein